MATKVSKSLIVTICLLAELTSVSLATVCDQLREVRVIPFKNEKVADVSYNAIVEAGSASIPCLVASVVNTQEMPDPRKAPPYGSFAVGDLASILLCKITGRPFAELLPNELRGSFLDRGVSVYFDYVKKPENRAALQADWKKWLNNK